MLRRSVGIALASWLASGALEVPRPLSAQAPTEVSLDKVRQAIAAAPRTRPRLLLTPAELAGLEQRVQRDPLAGRLRDRLLAVAEEMSTLPPVEHVVTGRRLLSVSRTAVARVLTQALAYRLTGEPRFLEGATREMLAAAAFPDWNPSHFLDTAEMSFALAVGYDWLHDSLTEGQRHAIRTALLEKGIGASLTHDGWVDSRSNWGQVCHAGITAAALTLMEDDPDLAARILHRSVTHVPISMASYVPDGTYPEGPGYWSYGTTYNVILIDELESALGTDFGLSLLQGFGQTASFVNHATGPSGLFFNYADGGANRGMLPPLHWFSGRFDRPDWLIYEMPILEHELRTMDAAEFAREGTRFFPLTLLWLPARTEPRPIRMDHHWLARGRIPVAMHRTSWTDPDALYVGIKAGTPQYHHGQMDTGSFVLDADGVRWAMDLGAESYHRIESRGMDLWARHQESDRWTVFRNNNFAHSTLVIGGQLQVAAGDAPILRHSEAERFPFTIVDLTPVYAGQATKAHRGIGIRDGAEVVVRDRVEGVGSQPVRWGMLTPAEVEILGPREAILRQEGKELKLRVTEPANARLEVYDTETPKAEWDSPNPGTRMIGFTVTAAGRPLDMAVVLTPGSRRDRWNQREPIEPLDRW